MIDDATYEDLRARLAQDFNSYFAPSALGDTVASINGWKKSVMGDGSFGRIFNGPQWLDRVAIRDGAINAAKVTSTFVIANTFTTADTTVTPTAARMEMTASGIKAYGTVSGIANTQTLSIANNGDFTFGSAASNPITYVASTGTLTVPAAVIGSLTIANVGTGTFAGTYSSSSSYPRLVMSPSAYQAWNVGGVQTAAINADGSGFFGSGGTAMSWTTSGVVTIPVASIGSLTIANVGAGILGGLYKTSSSNAHLELDTSGIRAYNTSATKTFDMVASSGELALTGNLTVGSGGKIKFGGSGADYLDNNILHFEVSTSEESVIEIKNGSNTPYGAFAGLASSTDSRASVQALASATRGGTITAFSAAASGTATLGSGYDATHYAQVTSQSLSTYASIDATAINGTTGTTGWSTLGHDTASSSYSQCQINGSAKLQVYAAGTYINNNLYPGGQSTRYIYDTGSYTGVSGGLAAGGAFYPTAQTAIYFDKNAGTGNARIKGANLELPDGHLQQVNFGAASGALPAATKYMPVFDLTAGALRYIPCYTSPGPWTA